MYPAACEYRGLGQYPPAGASTAAGGRIIVPVVRKPNMGLPPGTWDIRTPYWKYWDPSGQLWILWGNTGWNWKHYSGDATPAQPLWVLADDEKWPHSGPNGGAWRVGHGWDPAIRYLHVVDYALPGDPSPPPEWQQGGPAPQPAAPDPGGGEPPMSEPDPQPEPEPEPTPATIEGTMAYRQPYAGVAQTHMMVGEHVILPSQRYGSWNSLDVYNAMRADLREGDRVRVAGLEFRKRDTPTLIPRTFEILGTGEDTTPPDQRRGEDPDAPGIIDPELEPGGDPWWLDAPPGTKLKTAPPDSGTTPVADGEGEDGATRAGLAVPMPVLAAGVLVTLLLAARERKKD